MNVRSSMQEYLEKLSHHVPFENAILFYSLWEGYRDYSQVAKFLSSMESKGVKIVSLHTSGHADSQAISELIKATAPHLVMPVHTENAKWFERFADIQVIHDNTVRT